MIVGTEIKSERFTIEISYNVSHSNVAIRRNLYDDNEICVSQFTIRGKRSSKNIKRKLT
jgi:hypothetical protein